MRSALASLDDDAPPVGPAECLEALALSEVLIRKAIHGRQLDVRAARRAGASWTQVGASVGMSKQAAWEAHDRWINGQAELHRNSDLEGLDRPAEQAARDIAGGPED